MQQILNFNLQTRDCKLVAQGPALPRGHFFGSSVLKSSNLNACRETYPHIGLKSRQSLLWPYLSANLPRQRAVTICDHTESKRVSSRPWG